MAVVVDDDDMQSIKINVVLLLLSVSSLYLIISADLFLMKTIGVITCSTLKCLNYYC